MGRPPELWVFIISNMLLFIISSVLLTLSYFAYYQNPKNASYRYSTIGFGFIVLGGLVAPVYRLFIRSDYRLNVTERLLLQSGEGLLLAAGLGLLFYAITRHETNSSPTNGYSTSFEIDISDFDDRRGNR